MRANSALSFEPAACWRRLQQSKEFFLEAAPHQRCWAHKLRNLENKLKASQRDCLAEAKLIYQSAQRRQAVERFRAWQKRWRPEASKAVRCLEEDLEQMLAFFDYPPAHWKRLRTTNVIERLLWKCVGASAPCAPSPPAAVVRESSLVFLTV